MKRQRGWACVNIASAVFLAALWPFEWARNRKHRRRERAR